MNSIRAAVHFCKVGVVFTEALLRNNRGSLYCACAVNDGRVPNKMADRRSDDAPTSAPTLSVSYGQLQERKRHLKLTSHHHYHHNESSSDDTRSRPSPRSTSKDCSASSEGVSTRGESKKWLEWVSYEKRLERVCSRWAGSSDQLEQVLHIW